MVEIVGYNEMESKREPNKFYCIIYYKSDKKITEGNEYGSVIASMDYAYKLIDYCKSGGLLGKGWSKKEGREFLYIPKE